jgi:hypothetical protein
VKSNADVCTTRVFRDQLLVNSAWGRVGAVSECRKITVSQNVEAAIAAKKNVRMRIGMAPGLDTRHVLGSSRQRPKPQLVPDVLDATQANGRDQTGHETG